MAPSTLTACKLVYDHDTKEWIVRAYTHRNMRLPEADAANLHLHGRTDPALKAQIADGNLVLKASRTLQPTKAA
jgi:hypothetical protein